MIAQTSRCLQSLLIPPRPLPSGILPLFPSQTAHTLLPLEERLALASSLVADAIEDDGGFSSSGFGCIPVIPKLLPMVAVSSEGIPKTTILELLLVDVTKSRVGDPGGGGASLGLTPGAEIIGGKNEPGAAETFTPLGVRENEKEGDDAHIPGLVGKEEQEEIHCCAADMGLSL